MWPTSTGTRTLCGAEAAIVAKALTVMLETLGEQLCDDEDIEAFSEIPADMQLGIAVFDSLTIHQRIATLHHVAKHLLTDAMAPSDDVSAVDDGTVAAIFAEIRDQVAIEIDFDQAELLSEYSPNGDSELDSEDVSAWRSCVLAAYQQMTSLDEERDDDQWALPDNARDTRFTIWEDMIDMLASAILWDRDFELADGFLDQDPSAARHRRKLLGISEDYFVQPPLDPTTNQTRRMLAQARAYAARWSPL
jgi:hypothetical protein